ncbi:MAG: response regulator [Bacteroidota bacterium]
MTRHSKRGVKMNGRGKPARSETEKQGLRDTILSRLGPLTSQKSILIADDEEALGQLLSSELTSRGYVCVSLGSKSDAYNWSLQHHPDLIITDIKSPGMDGFQFVRLLKSNTETKRVPIVFLTGVASDENTEMAKSLGAAEVVSKPCKLADVQAVIERLIGNGQARPENPGGGRSGLETGRRFRL